ncbi:porin family protein [Pleomorphomonas diazotrophica]|uniref:Porin family protein n=1 Tax=Pleomorphomonas diazotrophica TaxID=1166257 RepID=A0A1I4UGW9_9HYPH|nr:outer membrane protein [Pleomorphomonas diazotrophica]PKR89211.1 porin family protein [Pleomorphomonas diazotrophica]SFM87963.1 outer membrane immunogenic protein [Pleomorphomonas diazotrophica]
MTLPQRIIAASFTSLFLGIGSAMAADLAAPDSVTVPQAEASAFDWTGFYVGASIGYGFGEETTDLQAFPDVPAVDFGAFDLDGMTGGVQAGYNRQFGSFVAGIEADFQMTGFDGQGSGSVNSVNTDTDFGIDWYGTLRPRVGYAFDRTLVYATGGFAFGSVSGTIDADDGGSVAARVESDSAGLGYAVGAGIEHALTENLSIKAEYQYVHLRAEGHGVVSSGGVDTGVTASTSFEPNLHTAKVGLNYRF